VSAHFPPPKSGQEHTSPALLVRSRPSFRDRVWPRYPLEGIWGACEATHELPLAHSFGRIQNGTSLSSRGPAFGLALRSKRRIEQSGPIPEDPPKQPWPNAGNSYRRRGLSLAPGSQQRTDRGTGDPGHPVVGEPLHPASPPEAPRSRCSEPPPRSPWVNSMADDRPTFWRNLQPIPPTKVASGRSSWSASLIWSPTDGGRTPG
jgi:hypothetical protein